MSAPPQVPGPATSPRKGQLWLWVLLLAVLLAGAGWWGYRALARRSALALARSGPFAEAAPLLQRELTWNPDDLPVLQALARGYLQAGDRAAARAPLDRWCSLQPGDPEPFRLRMDLLSKDQHHDAALADAQTAHRLEPENFDLLMPLAGLYFLTGNVEQAEKYCREVLARQAKRRDARRLLADILRAQGERGQAAEVLDGLLSEVPDDAPVMMTRASLYIEAGQAGAAIPLLESVAARPGYQRSVRYHLLQAYTQAGRTEDARRVQAEMHALQEAEVLRDALDSQPNNVDLQVRTARAWLAAAQVSQGLELLDRVLSAHPDHAGAHAVLADYYERIGQPERAAEHRRRAGGSR
jgi:predicted Zn-dependent protease